MIQMYQIYILPNIECPSGNSECEWSGLLYDYDDKDNVWKWDKNDIYESELILDTSIGDGWGWGTHVYYNNEIALDTSGAFWYYNSSVSNSGIIDYLCTNGSITKYNLNYANVSWFACDLTDNDDEYTWEEANDCCN